MNKKRWFIFSLIFIGFILFLGLLYLRLTSVRSNAAKTTTESILPPVKTIKIEPTESMIYKEVLGRVEGGQAVNIRSNVSGWVKSIYLKRGEKVSKNQAILQLNDERTEVRLLEAGYNLKAAKSTLQETQRKYDRNVSLLEKGIVAKDEVEANLNQLESDKANVKALEASYSRIKWDFDRLRIKSPIDGELVEVDPDVGQEVLNGEVVAKVVNLKTKKIIAGLDASIARLISPGTEVELILSNVYGKEVVAGSIVGISQNFDDVSGTYEAEIKIIEDDVDWWPGEVVNVKIPIKKLSNVVEIPRTSVLSDSNEIFIFVVSDGKTQRVPVDVTWAGENKGYVSIDSIPPNSEIVVEGNTGLTSGEKIKVVN